jgi:hypothetical protein
MVINMSSFSCKAEQRAYGHKCYSPVIAVDSGNELKYLGHDFWPPDDIFVRAVFLAA